jgi:hypothetical protein
MSKYLSEWRALVKKMRKHGFTIGAISDTLHNLGRRVPDRTIYRICEGIIQEGTPKYHDLSFLDAALFICDDLPIDTFDPFSGIEVLGGISEIEEMFPEPVQSSPGVFDLSGTEDLDPLKEFGGYSPGTPPHVWYPTKTHKDGLRSYLEYERRQNRQEEKLDYRG